MERAFILRDNVRKHMFDWDNQTLLLIVFVWWLARRGANRGEIAGSSLVLRKFLIDETPQAALVLDIAGRRSGLFAWLLTVVGFDAETSLKASSEEVEFRTASIFGKVHRVVPLSSVSSTQCGYTRPVGYIIVAGIILILAIFMKIGSLFDPYSGLPSSTQDPILFVAVVIGVGCLLAYIFLKRLTVSLETSGGTTLSISFRRSLIENVAVDIEKATKAIELLNRRIVARQGR